MYSFLKILRGFKWNFEKWTSAFMFGNSVTFMKLGGNSKNRDQKNEIEIYGRLFLDFTKCKLSKIQIGSIYVKRL